VTSNGRGFQENCPADEKFLSAILTEKTVEFAGMVQQSSWKAAETEKSARLVLDQSHLNICRSRVSAEFHVRVSKFISSVATLCHLQLSAIF